MDESNDIRTLWRMSEEENPELETQLDIWMGDTTQFDNNSGISPALGTDTGDLHDGGSVDCDVPNTDITALRNFESFEAFCGYVGFFNQEGQNRELLTSDNNVEQSSEADKKGAGVNVDDNNNAETTITPEEHDVAKTASEIFLQTPSEDKIGKRNSTLKCVGKLVSIGKFWENSKFGNKTLSKNFLQLLNADGNIDSSKLPIPKLSVKLRIDNEGTVQIFACQSCHKEHESRFAIMQHRCIMCEICRLFVETTEVLNHLYIFHAIALILPRSDKPGNTLTTQVRQVTVTATSSQVICKICDRVSPDAESYAKHSRVHLICKEAYRLLTCQICGEMFRTEEAVKIHKLSHPAEPPKPDKTKDESPCGKSCICKSGIYTNTPIPTTSQTEPKKNHRVIKKEPAGKKKDSKGSESNEKECARSSGSSMKLRQHPSSQSHCCHFCEPAQRSRKQVQDGTQFLCKVCRKWVPLASLVGPKPHEHVIAEKWRCPLCLQQLTSLRGYQLHVKCHIRKPQEHSQGCSHTNGNPGQSDAHTSGYRLPRMPSMHSRHCRARTSAHSSTNSPDNN